MQKIIIYILSVALLLSCKKEENINDYTVDLKITPSVAVQATKALVDGSTISTQSIGIHVTDAAGSALYQTGSDNIALTYAASMWNLSSTVALTSTSAKIYAYAPYSNTTGDLTGTGSTAQLLLNIPSSRIMTAQTDYLWAAQSTSGGSAINASNSSVALNLNHAMAQVAFVIYKGDYQSPGNLTQISITDNSASPGFKVNKEINNDLKMSLANGIVSGGNTSSTLTVTGLTNTINLTSDPGTAPATLDGLKNGYILVTPVSIADQTKIQFTFTIDNVAYTVSLGSGSVNWQKGNQYIYKVKLGKTTMSVSGVTVAPWGTNAINKIDTNGDDLVIPTANSYIVAPGASITIPVNIKGNGDDASAALGNISTTHTAVSVGKLWETADGLVTLSNFNPATQTVTITASASPGNAVIAAYDTDGTTVLWSWHIWVTATPAEESINGNIWMDRNLGATGISTNSSGATFATCGGLFYQWGRKDPFPGSNGSTTGAATVLPIFNFTKPAYTGLTVGTSDTYVSSADAGAAPISYTSQLSYSIMYPLLFLNNWAGSTASAIVAYTAAGGKDSWSGEYGQLKSIFDPCPAGWRVPNGKKASSSFTNPWSTWTSTRTMSTSTYSGLRWYNGTYLSIYYYPGAGYRNALGGVLGSVGSYGYYWTATPNGSTSYNMYFKSLVKATVTSVSRASGYSVRCVKE